MMNTFVLLGKGLVIVAVTVACLSAGGQYAERISNVSKGAGKHSIRRTVNPVVYTIGSALSQSAELVAH